MKNDKRYKVALEFCGYDKPQFVIRFCGSLIGIRNNFSDAYAYAVSHKTQLFNV